MIHISSCPRRHLALLVAFTSLCLQVFPVRCQQSFATTPVDTEVVEGQDVTLQCAVDNLQGRIIWSKDDVLLGSDRSLPGYDRYTVKGDATREGNLEIQRADISDDAEYRCHVTATDATHQNLRSEPAAVIVLLPPDPPVIDNQANGSSITIQPPATVTLPCRANNGKPAPVITWLKGGDDLAYGNPEVVSTPAGDPTGKRVNAVSTLTLNPEKEDNGVTYACKVSHGALSSPLLTYVTLDVRFPPSAPVISGYSAGTIVKTGDVLLLRCTSLGGNPLAEVYWYKNDARMDYSFMTDGVSAFNSLPLDVDYSDNNAIYKCVATSVVLAEPMSTQIQLSVNFAPAYVNITGHEKMVQSDATLTLKCTSANSNPASSISWFTGGRQVHTHDDVVVEAPNGGFVTSQELTITMTADTDSVDYMCQATNQELYETTSDTVTVNVMYPPENPGITGYEVGTEVKAENLLRLVCFAMGGNPLATLVWYKNGEVQEAETGTQSILSTSTLRIILDETDNGAVYSCNASNEATPVPLQASVTLNVLFPPSSVTVSVDPPEAKEGDSVTVTCETASSNPESEISWWRDGVPIENTNNISTEVLDAENGGKRTRSRLHLESVTSANNGGVYLCRAMSDLVVESVNDGVTLDIKFKPKITTPTGISLSSHEVPGDLALNCSAEANPPDVTFTWNKDAAEINVAETERYTLDEEGSLLIHNVSREEAGTYMCLASNSEGASNITATLDVLYSAKVTTGEAITITLNTPGELACEADANPKPAGYITWTRPGFDLTGYAHEYVDGRGIMRVDNVTKAVSGMYLCHADNGIPPADTKNIQVIIQYPPEVDHSMPNKVAKSTGQTALLRCRAEGSPLVQFNWFKGSAEVNLTSDHYTLDIRQDLTYANRYESRLIISQIDEIDDYGTYVCKAYNDLGEARFEIQLEKTSPPEAPSNLQVVEISFDSVTLNWTKGFDGGLDQTFQVRFNQKGGKQYQYVDVSPSTSTTFTVSNLNPNSDYEFTVRGRNAQGDGPYYLGIVSAKTTVKPTEPPVEIPTRLLVGNIPLYMVLLFSFLCILSCVFINIFLCCCLVKRRESRKKVAAKSSSIQKKTDEVELVKPVERPESPAYSDSNTDNMSHRSEHDDRYSYDNVSYDRRRYDDYSDGRSENYDHYDDRQPPISPRVVTSRGGPGYYEHSTHRPPSYAQSWDSYENPPSTGLSESQIDDNEEREYADMLRRQQKAQYMAHGGAIQPPTAPSPVPSSLGNFVPLPKGGSAAPSQVGSEEGYLV
ncbi:nephrin-like [Lytechinus pictus]|uniref:nephrin-like n=1 Tax=Lytechinus pictus TaxID=7653 RepID=UPI0030BA081D